jgi:hypothetical protein
VTDGQVQIIGAPTIPHPPPSPEKKPPISRWEHRYLGEDRFPRALSALEIEHFFTLDEGELAAVRQRRSALNGLALALQVGFLRMTGRTLNSVELIPPEVLDHLGRQLDCSPPRLASIRAAGAAGPCSSIRPRPSDCSAAANSPRMPSAGWWPICAGRRPPFSTRPN